MPKFEIANRVSGLVLGVYEGADSDEALDALARDAGYADFKQSCGITDPDDTGAEIEKRRAELSVTVI